MPDREPTEAFAGSAEIDHELRCSAALSCNPDTKAALDEVCRQASAELGTTADLAMLFASAHHAQGLEQAASVIAREIPVDCLLGCTGQAIVGTGREVEATPALSLWVASLPQASILPMHLEYQQTPDGGTFVGWPDETPDQWSPGAVLLLLGDPFSFPADDLVSRLNEDQPGIPIVGGMASGAIAPGRNRLLLGQHVHRHGAVAAILQGRFRMDTVVSQGCRPVGDPFVITKADGNVILELAGVPALDQLQKVVADLSPAEQQCASQGLHLGRVVSEYQDERARGDYLIRNVLGIDRASGAIAVGDLVRPGQTVQFHIRDAGAADQDLGHLLGKARDRCADQPARGALLFTCNGRGSNLFDEPDHDAGLLSFCLGRIPTAGFFAAGELGPIGSKNYLHGYTASIALFAPLPD